MVPVLRSSCPLFQRYQNRPVLNPSDVAAAALFLNSRSAMTIVINVTLPCCRAVYNTLELLTNPTLELVSSGYTGEFVPEAERDLQPGELTREGPRTAATDPVTGQTVSLPRGYQVNMNVRQDNAGREYVRTEDFLGISHNRED